MKSNTSGIFKRISIFVFSIIAFLSIVFIIITYFGLTYFFKASTELLHKDVAAHIAKFTSPFETDSINKRKADSVFYNAMVLNPSIEVYFLDTSGNVLYYHSPDSSIKLHKIPLDEIKNYIYSEGDKYVTGYDPKHANEKKIFSAAQVYKEHKLVGYIYVILGSSEYGNVTGLLFTSFAWQLVLFAFIVVIIISLLISIYYIKRLQLNYKKVIDVLDEYKKGNFDAQFFLKDNNEFTPITDAFNNITTLLSSSMKKLQKSERDRRDFIATISHDLQSPLSIARGYAETMLIQDGDAITQSHKEYLKLIQSKIIQVEKMVLQLTELSKMEEVNFKPHKEPFVLSEVVQETVNTFQLTAMEKHIDLRCAECKYHVWINADVRMMERVVQNLVDNAVKNTLFNGNIQVSILVEDKWLLFEIINTGKALPEEIFKWVNNSDVELSDRPSNAGLGLLIVKKILRLHNTALSLSIINKKNIFKFKLPIMAQPLLTAKK